MGVTMKNDTEVKGGRCLKGYKIFWEREKEET